MEAGRFRLALLNLLLDLSKTNAAREDGDEDAAVSMDFDNVGDGDDFGFVRGELILLIVVEVVEEAVVCIEDRCSGEIVDKPGPERLVGGSEHTANTSVSIRLLSSSSRKWSSISDVPMCMGELNKEEKSPSVSLKASSGSSWNVPGLPGPLNKSGSCWCAGDIHGVLGCDIRSSSRACTDGATEFDRSPSEIKYL